MPKFCRSLSKPAVKGAVAAFAFAGAAHAGSVLQIDLNSLVVDAGGAFGGLNHTGTLLLTDDGTTSFASILIDGMSQSVSPEVAGIKGSIDLNNGAVVGGAFAVSFTDGSMYSATLIGGGGVNEAADPGGAGPGPFTIDTLTAGGAFSGLVNGNEFGGVDVTEWVLGEPLSGSILTFKFGPDDNGFDSNADMDVFVTSAVPLAPAGWAGFAGLAGLASMRRRRELVS